MGTKQKPTKISIEQRRDFIMKHWDLFKRAVPVSTIAQNDYVKEFARLARKEFNYSDNTWNPDIMRGFLPAFYLIVEEKGKIITE